jgi:hypothetical protein
MNVLVALFTLALLGAVILLLSAPLRAARRPPDPESIADRAELEAAREAKYREIRDAEMDYRTGKLSSEDYAAIDGALRAEAVAILDRLTALGEEEPEARASAAESQTPERAPKRTSAG